MKICYLNKGISVHDQKILAELVKQGNDVHLLSFQKGDLLPLPGVTLHRMPFPSSLVAFPLASLMTPALVRKIKPDILIGNYLLTYGFYAALSYYHPLLQIAWGSDVLLAPENPLYRQVVKYSLRHADLTIVDCETGKQAIIGLGYPAERIVILPYGIDFNRFNPDVDGRRVREALGWRDNFIVVCTRQHSPIYGMKYLVEAMPHVIRREPAARFLLIGSGSLTAQLKKQAKELKVEEYLKFTGTMANEELPAYLAASNLYVSPSLSDGTSVCLLEAMASGLPVVVTDVEAILEWITDGENGLVVPKKNAVALSEAICKMLGDKTLGDAFGQENYRIAKARASWEDNSKILRNACQSLVRE